jgi:cytochrome c biogenesis protein CcmG/thiol:disulfide interchange protein DsbE
MRPGSGVPSQHPTPVPSGPAAAPKSHRARIAAIGVAVVGVALLVVLGLARAGKTGGENLTVTDPLLGRQAPSFNAPELGGGELRLGRLRGHFVLVNFFASWCDPCREEAPELAGFAFEHRFGQDKVDVVGVLFDDSAANAIQFVRTYGVDYPVVTDPSGQIAVAYGVENPPTSVLISPTGRVIDYLIGGVTTNGLNRLLAEARHHEAQVRS